MISGTAIRLKGADDLMKALGALDQDVKTKLGRSATRAGALVMKKAITAAAPVGPGKAKLRRNKSGDLVVMDYGHLRDNISIKAVPKNARVVQESGGYFEFWVGPGRAFWGSFLEFGTVHMAAKPFMRPAFDANKQAAVDKIGDVLGRGIVRLAARG